MVDIVQPSSTKLCASERLFSGLVNRSAGATPPPESLIEEAQRLSHVALSPDDATAAYLRIAAELPRYAPDVRLFVACALLLEKRRMTDGMFAAWTDLQTVFPTEPIVVRMLMRWYRRSRQIEEGLQRLHQITPDLNANVDVAELRLQGYQELNAYTEIDKMMAKLLSANTGERNLRVKYIQALMKQKRFHAAALVARDIDNRERLGPGSQALIKEAEAQASRMNLTDSEDVTNEIGQIVGRLRSRHSRPVSADGIGPLLFFTGQLGAGGAERQFTRLAAALQSVWEGNLQVGPHRLLAPPVVCVRHATASTGADFFLPVLKSAGVRTEVLANLPLPDRDALCSSFPELAEILPLLPEDLQQNTLKLLPLFRNARIETAYLWQDGGVLTAALAALLAGVPRIITSFRGLPPNLRPELMRPQMPKLFTELARLPGVSFTANSLATAVAYEEWLGLPAGFVQIIHNAVPTPAPEGAAEDEAIWAKIVDASPDCNKTVLGIFRFDHNKRPDMWVRSAISYAKRHLDTRFLILGTGVELASCRQLIEEAGMNNRVFLPGATRQVGYFLHRADLVMHLARFEGLPNVLIEAQLAGRPVLATPAGGTAEIVAHGKTGLILGDNLHPDPSEIQHGLDFLLSDRERLRQMGSAAKNLNQHRFQLDRILQATLSLFDAAATGETSLCALS